MSCSHSLCIHLQFSHNIHILWEQERTLRSLTCQRVFLTLLYHIYFQLLSGQVYVCFIDFLWIGSQQVSQFWSLYPLLEETVAYIICCGQMCNISKVLPETPDMFRTNPFQVILCWFGDVRPWYISQNIQTSELWVLVKRSVAPL